MQHGPPRNSITAELTVEFNHGNYGSTGWVISDNGSGDLACVPHEAGASPATVDFDITAPTEPGSYTATFVAYNGNVCSSFGGDSVTVAVTVTSPAGVTVTPTSGLVTTEGGDTATFTVVLASQPTDDVTIGLSSDDETEGTALPVELTFTSNDWDDPQTVDVTGVDDDAVDGDIGYLIELTASSDDGSYNGLTADVSVTNTDDDAAGITVSETDLVTTEGNGTDTFTVELTSKPSADVTIGLTSDDESEGTVSPTSLTFTDANWNTAQTVTVTGVDDSDIDGDVAYTIDVITSSDDDDDYKAIDPAEVAVTNIDNDAAGILVSGADLVTTEGNGTATFTVELTSKPSADVTIALSSDDTTEGTVLPASLTFTSGNWDTAQTVTVTGVDDSIIDGDVAYTIDVITSSDDDDDYKAIDPAEVAVTNIDNDSVTTTVTNDVTPSDADECKDDLWIELDFRNQGLCISHGDDASLLAAGGGPPWPKLADWEARDRGNGRDD